MICIYIKGDYIETPRHQQLPKQKKSFRTSNKSFDLLGYLHKWIFKNQYFSHITKNS